MRPTAGPAVWSEAAPSRGNGGAHHWHHMRHTVASLKYQQWQATFVACLCCLPFSGIGDTPLSGALQVARIVTNAIDAIHSNYRLKVHKWSDGARPSDGTQHRGESLSRACSSWSLASGVWGSNYPQSLNVGPVESRASLVCAADRPYFRRNNGLAQNHAEPVLSA